MQGLDIQETIEYYKEQVQLEEFVALLLEKAIHEQYLSQLDKIFTTFMLRT